MAAERAAWKASQPETGIQVGVHRRDGSLHQNGAALWSFALWPALCRSDPTWPFEDDNLCRRAQGDRHDCADGPRRSHGWLGVRGLRDASSRADAQAARRPGDGNLAAHKWAEVGLAIAAAGARLPYLPPYSPDLNPIEMAFAKLKAALRKAAARSIEPLDDAIARALAAFTAQDCLNFFAAAGDDRV